MEGVGYELRYQADVCIGALRGIAHSQKRFCACQLVTAITRRSSKLRLRREIAKALEGPEVSARTMCVNSARSTLKGQGKGTGVTGGHHDHSYTGSRFGRSDQIKLFVPRSDQINFSRSLDTRQSVKSGSPVPGCNRSCLTRLPF